MQSCSFPQLRFAIVITSLLTFCASAILAHKEFSALQQNALATSQQISQTDYPLSFSNRYRTTALTNCIENLMGKTLDLYPSKDRAAYASFCASLAQKSLYQSPTFSLAYLTKAVSTLGSKYQRSLNAQLILSKKTAPYEGWLAEYRVAMALTNWRSLTIQTQIWIKEDIALLLNGFRTRSFIAQQYLQNKGQRELILSIAQEQSPRVQTAFYLAVRALAL